MPAAEHSANPPRYEEIWREVLLLRLEIGRIERGTRPGARMDNGEVNHELRRILGLPVLSLRVQT